MASSQIKLLNYKEFCDYEKQNYNFNHNFSALLSNKRIKGPNFAKKLNVQLPIDNIINMCACSLNKVNSFFDDISIYIRSVTIQSLENVSIKMNMFMGW